ncbi:ribonuclease H-like protein [Hirsutella rhossiliensis]
MDSASVLSFFDAESILSDSTTSRSRNTRGKAAIATWKHARVAAEGEEEFKGRNRLLYCSHCPQTNPYSTSVTTNFRKHLEGKHDIRVVEDLTPLQSSIFEGLSNSTSKHGNWATTEIESEVFKRYLDQDKINKALAWLIVARNLPYRIVESREFHLFISTLNPVAKDHLLPPTRLFHELSTIISSRPRISCE